ncbi:hypothetical protein [Peribacillus asahii]|uniref:hypothetical protein n=1 Tax=Peribacillus asahii TaxID=228899 RepID=UPI00207AAA67|nr:hypothetical protein [Peribacillus asahii]USK71148.1 hypothetical protein LIS76_05130 [Peribacillus asahii]
MSGKDVWRWMLNKFDDGMIFKIYQEKKISCNGFRNITIHNVKTNRSRLITNLLSNLYYKKLLSWCEKEAELSMFEKNSLEDKEINELVLLATEHGTIPVLLQLFKEQQETKAVQLFAELKDEESGLLEISNQSIGHWNMPKEKKNDIKESQTEKDEKKKMKQEGNTTASSKQEEKKIEKLARKNRNLIDQLEQRDEQYKTKIEDMEKKHSAEVKRLNGKITTVSLLLKEKEDTITQYQKEKLKWDKERNKNQIQIELLEQKIKELQKELEEKEEKEDKEEKEEQKTSNEVDYRILIVGEPGSKSQFESDNIQFLFVPNEEVHSYDFMQDFDYCWVLCYELSRRDQYLLKQNQTYNELDESKLTICNEFSELRRFLNQYVNGKVRAF